MLVLQFTSFQLTFPQIIFGHSNRWMCPEVDQMQCSGCQLQRLLRRKVYAKTLSIQFPERSDALRGWLGQENILGRVRGRHDFLFTAKAAPYRQDTAPHKKGCCMGPTARAPCWDLCHAHVLIPNPML